MKYIAHVLLAAMFFLLILLIRYTHLTSHSVPPQVDELWMDQEHHGYKVEIVEEDGLILTSICNDGIVIAPMATFREYFTPAEGELLCEPTTEEPGEPSESAEGIPL